MNFKISSFVALLIISMFLLSSCEVYQTLYGAKTAPQNGYKGNKEGKVERLEGPSAKDPQNLAKIVYAAALPIPHDPFKVGSNPLGPFDEGKSLGFTLGQWLSASGIGIYSVDNSNSQLELSFKNLVPNGVYTLWCSRIKFPPEPQITDMPCGAPDGSENSFKADEKGAGSFSLKLKSLESSTKETASIIALAYHSDGQTYGPSPGDFGLNSHVQLFFLLPEPAGNATKFEVPIKFTNHIDAGMPEQDVYVEKAEEIKKEEVKVEPKPEVPAQNPAVTGETTKETKTEEQKPKEKPIVVVVQETDLVNLVPKAQDADKGTTLTFTFTSPVNEKGQWKTNYGDAGEYTITVTASDGESTTSRDVLIIVNKKEEAPTIDNVKPIESGLTLDEEQSVDFTIQASDLNKDPLTFSWKLDGNGVSTDDKYTYQTDFDSAGTHTVKAEASDGTTSVSKIWSVNVKNVNRKPVLQHIDDLNAKETDKIQINAQAADDDKDSLTYSIDDKRFKQDGNAFTWETDYDSAGTYDVTVSVSDGKDTTSQKVKVTVENVNRPPVIEDITQKQ